MILRDQSIRREIEKGRVKVEPFIDENVQPASLDLTLDGHFKIMRKRGYPIDPYNLGEDLYEDVHISQGYAFAIEAGMCVLGSTVEHIEVPRNMALRFEGKSSLGRLFLLVHATAGFFDPGFKGTGTLEFTYLGPDTLLLWPGMKIAHVSFHMLDGDAVHPYGDPALNSKYQDQSGPAESRYDQNAKATL